MIRASKTSQLGDFLIGRFCKTVLEATLGVAAEGEQVLLAKDCLECCRLPCHLRGLGVLEEDVHSVLRNPQVSCNYREDLGSMGFVLIFTKFSNAHEESVGTGGISS